jgi:hypothetical protein
MLFSLYGLPIKYSSIRDRILGSSILPIFNLAWSILCVLEKPSDVDVHHIMHLITPLIWSLKAAIKVDPSNKQV